MTKINFQECKLPALIYKMPRLFGLSMVSAKRKDVAEYLTKYNGGRVLRVAFANAHCINVMHLNAEYNRALESADLVLPDGSGIRLAAYLYGQKFAENLNGTDLFPVLCRVAAKRRRSMYFVGGRSGVASEVAKIMH